MRKGRYREWVTGENVSLAFQQSVEAFLVVFVLRIKMIEIINCILNGILKMLAELAQADIWLQKC